MKLSVLLLTFVFLHISFAYPGKTFGKELQAEKPDNISDACWKTIQNFTMVVTQAMEDFIKNLDSNDEFQHSELAEGQFEHLPMPLPEPEPEPEPLRCGLNPVNNMERLVGGMDAKPTPWMVMIKQTTANGAEVLQCGGSLISNSHVLTAARCFDNNNTEIYNLGFGIDSINASGVWQKINKKNVIIHENYHAATSDNDIAIISLDSPVPYSNVIQPICLPTSFSVLDNPGYPAVISGWGKTASGGNFSPVLKQLEVIVVAPKLCPRRVLRNNYDNEMRICAGFHHFGGQGVCDGDYGGPLQIFSDFDQWVAVGIVSNGNCGKKGTTGVYTRVEHYTDWIAENAPEAQFEDFK